MTASQGRSTRLEIDSKDVESVGMIYVIILTKYSNYLANFGSADMGTQR
jgi:hypothetical protein